MRDMGWSPRTIESLLGYLKCEKGSSGAVRV